MQFAGKQSIWCAWEEILLHTIYVTIALTLRAQRPQVDLITGKNIFHFCVLNELRFAMVFPTQELL